MTLERNRYTTISISPEVHKEAKKFIAEEELSMKEFVESLILEKINKKKE